MTRALPTTTEKGILFFHQSETYELICNYASCWWVTHSHQRTVVRNNWPVAMYISDAFTDQICKKCGNNSYISLISNITFWQHMFRIPNIKLNKEFHTICFQANIPSKKGRIIMEFFAITLRKVILEKGYLNMDDFRVYQ